VSYCEFFYIKVPESVTLVKIRGCPVDREEPAHRRAQYVFRWPGTVDGKGFGVLAKCGEALATI
jgi:hypothetical protein